MSDLTSFVAKCSSIAVLLRTYFESAHPRKAYWLCYACGVCKYTPRLLIFVTVSFTDTVIDHVLDDGLGA